MSNALKIAGALICLIGLPTDSIKSLCITSSIGIVIYLIGHYMEYRSEKFQRAVNAEVNRRIRERYYEN